MQTSILLSIKPIYANAILSGEKKYEFRRALFRNKSVRRVYIYASSPMQKVIGEFVIDEVLSMQPKELWQATSKGSGIEKSYFDSYFADCDLGHALKVQKAKKYRQPRSLTEHFGINRPPQSFCYV